MSHTKELMLAKIREIGDTAEAVSCRYRTADGERHRCTVGELPAGELASFFARSESHVYFQAQRDRIEAWDLLFVHSLS